MASAAPAQTSSIDAEVAFLKLALAGIADAVRRHTMEDPLELGADEDFSWGRQMSEPVKVRSTINVGNLPGKSPSGSGVQPGLLQGPSGFGAMRGGGLLRQLSEPVKMSDPVKVQMTSLPCQFSERSKLGNVHMAAFADKVSQGSRPAKLDMTTFAGDFSKHWSHGKLGSLVGELGYSGEDLTASGSTSSGDDMDSYQAVESPSYGPQPTSLLPCSVTDRGLLTGPSGAGSPGQKNTSSLTVVVRRIPEAYTEELYLEELRDGGFIKRRDFNQLDFNLEEGVCCMSFVNAVSMRSFIAAFDGRETRHAGDCEFEVVPC